MSTACPDPERLLAYVLGKLPEPDIQAVATHVESCPACESTAEALEEASDTLVTHLSGPLPESEIPLDPGYQEAVARVKAMPAKPSLAQTSVEPPRKSEEALFGEYRLLSKLGQGGMGVVWKAEHRRMQRLVAIKTLPVSKMKSPDAVARFYREVQTAAKLSHPNIVRAYDAGEHQGVHFLVMEYVEGQDLARLVKHGGPLPARQAAEYILQAARGLQYAHQQGIVHRDIKPANLLVDRKGTVKIVDMGLARIEEGFRVQCSAEERLTESGQMMGTCDYMAPEQALDCHKADARSDIYSLGCTLYRLLTGNAPYQGETFTQIFVAHLNDPIPSLCNARPDITAELDAIFHKMVAKRPEDRYQTTAEVVADLESLLNPNRPSAGEEFESSGALAFLKESSRAVACNHAPSAPESRACEHAPYGRRTLAVGLLVALVAVALAVFGMIITIRKGGRATTVEVPPGSKLAVGPKGDVDLTLPEQAVKRSGGQWAVASGQKPVSPLPLRERGGGKGAAPSYALEFDGTKNSVNVSSLDLSGVKSLTIEADLVPSAKLSVTDSSPLAARAWTITYLHPEARDTKGRASDLAGKWRFEASTPWTKYKMTVAYSLNPWPINKHALVAGVWDGKQIRLYIDGRQQTEPQPVDRTESLRGPGLVLGLAFAGQIDEVRVSSIARYDQDFTPTGRFESDQHTLALYHFDEGQGDVLHDSSGHGHDGKIVGAKWVKVEGSGFGVQGSANSGQEAALSPQSPTPNPQSPTPDLAIAPFDAKKAREHQEGWAKHLGVPVEMTNSIGMKLALIPPGEFDMGCTPEEIERERADIRQTEPAEEAYFVGVTIEKPRHRVKMTKPFYLATCPVTQEEYERLMDLNPSDFAAKQMDASVFQPPLDKQEINLRSISGKNVADKHTGRHPVDMVNWEEAMEFCRKLSSLPAERAARRVYRLPTEAEWEYACRAGTTTRWSFGDDAAALKDYGWFDKNSKGATHPVGQKKPNAWGLYDLPGNTWEWCHDWFGKDYYEQSPPNDPLGPTSGYLRVVRGGAWNAVALRCRSAHRIGAKPAYHNHSYGFRVVVEISANTR